MGQAIDDLFDTLVIESIVKDLIADGHLSPFEVFAPQIGISTEGLQTLAGDFNKNQLAQAVDKPTIVGDAVKTYQKLASGKQAIVFCVSIEH